MYNINYISYTLSIIFFGIIPILTADYISRQITYNNLECEIIELNLKLNELNKKINKLEQN